MARRAHPLRDQFQRAVLDFIERHSEDFERSTLIQTYVDLGVTQSTAYRWLADVLATGRVAVDRAKPDVAHLAARAAAGPAPDITPALPPLPRAEEVATAGSVPVVKILRDSIKVARDLIEQAHGSDGKVRNARMALAAAEYLRKCVETAAKLNESIGLVEEMNNFHRILMEEIGREPLPVQERIFARIRVACDAALAT
jgi:hypothetical protein